MSGDPAGSAAETPTLTTVECYLQSLQLRRSENIARVVFGIVRRAVSNRSVAIEVRDDRPTAASLVRDNSVPKVEVRGYPGQLSLAVLPWINAMSRLFQ